ncbi:MAG TPA: hypothetical protein VKU86_14780, partial [Acidimicrobiales bacterium]|nr:hypothetical protein [Acidimicrobiales bacterium]
AVLMTGPGRRRVGSGAAVVAIAALLVSCGGAPPSVRGDGSPATSVNAQVGADHACVVPGSTRPALDWSALRNPILSDPNAGEKDQALVWAFGQWHMLFSYVTHDVPVAGAEHWNIATAASPDLVHWSPPVPWPAQSGVAGVASPDIVRAPSGAFVATYDSGPGETNGGQAKLYYRTSSDLVTWSAPSLLAPELHPQPGDRLIDPALAWTGHGLVLGYKYGPVSNADSQHFEVAWSPSGSLAGPWQVVGRPDIVVYGDTVENLEFVALGGRWWVVATSNRFDQPWIFQLVGDPSRPSAWRRWGHGRMLGIPSQGWDSGPGISSVGFEHANSVFLCDARGATGYYYATYAGSSELTHFGGWGHAEIGIARSTDLIHWQVPTPSG